MQKICLLFPGGGTQYIGMGKALCNESLTAVKIFEEAEDLLKQDIRKLCFHGPFDKLSLMSNSQPAIYTSSIAAYKVYEEKVGITPVFSAGHSLGEYAALTCAGAISFQDGINLVKSRGQIFQDTAKSDYFSVAAINKLSVDLVEEECSEINRKGGLVHVSVYNSPLQVVVAGERTSMSKLAKQVENLRGEINYLNIASPSHSPLMKDESVKLKDELLKYTYKDFRWTVISNVDGLPYKDNKDIINRLVSHMFTPVKWHQSINYILQKGVVNFIDMGPQSVLSNLTKFISDKAHSYTFDSMVGIENILAAIQTSQPDYLLFIKKCLVTAISTKNFNTDLEEYNKKVVEPYKLLLTIRNSYKNRTLPKQDIMQILSLLNNILKYKLILEKERYRLLEDIIKESNITEIEIDFN